MNPQAPDPIAARLMAAKHGEQWQPHPLVRRIEDGKGGERLQQLWLSTIGRLHWRNVPLFTATGEVVNEGLPDEPIYNADGTPSDGGASNTGGAPSSPLPSSPIQR